MKNHLLTRYGAFLPLMAVLVAGPVFAEKSSKGEGGKHGHKEHEQRYEHREDRDRHDDEHRRRDEFKERYFDDHHRTAVRDYYAEQFRTGHCPPGLAKKHNGCVPPGQARKWVVGQPLPRDVIYYDVPAGMFGNPPPGYRFVRVASDILMIAVGTGMVMDAMTDLNAW